jgi:hypothetical protein
MVTLLHPYHYLDRQQQTALNLVPRSCRDINTEESHRKLVFVQCGIDCQDAAPKSKDYVRGAVHAYLLMGQEEMDGSLTLTLCVSIDPQGSIPARLVELTNEEQCVKLSAMSEILQEIGPLPRHPY